MDTALNALAAAREAAWTAADSVESDGSSCGRLRASTPDMRSANAL